jgi:hypothetical protein
MYSWCSDASKFSKVEAVGWVNATKEPGNDERCLVLQAKAASYGLDFSQCGVKNSVLCEVSFFRGCTRLLILFFSQNAKPHPVHLPAIQT